MSTTPGLRRANLTERVAEEIRAEMGRRRISGAQIARKLGKSEAWVSYRLSGKQPIDLLDLEAICEVLGVRPVELVIRAERVETQMNSRFPSTSERPTGDSLTPARRPHGTRPDGRPLTGLRRPERVAHQPIAA
jgi:transcriptional regulator with XRE-family HTH domain